MAETLDPYWFPCDGPWLGVPHGLDVLTNLPFLVLGLVGLCRLRALAAPHPWRRPWTALWTWIAMLAAGSGLYHLLLVPWALTADRVCIAGINAALCWLAWARVRNARLGYGTGLLLLGLFEAPVLAWWWLGLTSLVYGLSQAVAAAAVFVLHVRRARAETGAPPVWPLLALAACYAGAKLLELADGPICRATGCLGGHPLKHLLSAIGLAFLLCYQGDDVASQVSATR